MNPIKKLAIKLIVMYPILYIFHPRDAGLLAIFVYSLAFGAVLATIWIAVEDSTKFTDDSTTEEFNKYLMSRNVVELILANAIAMASIFIASLWIDFSAKNFGIAREGSTHEDVIKAIKKSYLVMKEYYKQRFIYRVRITRHRLKRVFIVKVYEMPSYPENIDVYVPIWKWPVWKFKEWKLRKEIRKVYEESGN